METWRMAKIGMFSRIHDFISEKLFLRRVTRTLRSFDTIHKLSDLDVIVLMNSIEDEAIRKACVSFNHSVSRLFTALEYNQFDRKSLNIFLEREFDLCSKYLSDLRQRYDSKVAISQGEETVQKIRM
jgi:hypothetical protein